MALHQIRARKIWRLRSKCRPYARFQVSLAGSIRGLDTSRFRHLTRSTRSSHFPHRLSCITRSQLSSPRHYEKWCFVASNRSELSFICSHLGISAQTRFKIWSTLPPFLEFGGSASSRNRDLVRSTVRGWCRSSFRSDLLRPAVVEVVNFTGYLSTVFQVVSFVDLGVPAFP